MKGNRFSYFIFLLIAMLHTALCFAIDVPSINLEERLIADLRLLANHSLAPLEGFMNEEDYKSVIAHCRLSNGQLFPIPIVLPVDSRIAEEALACGELLLRDEKQNPLALCLVEDIYEPDLEAECLSTLGTLDMNHPSTKEILNRSGKKYIGAKIQPLPYLIKMDKDEGVLSPDEVQAFFQENQWDSVVAFQTRNPLHKAHVALIKNCLNQVGEDASLFLQPVIGPTQDEDVPARIRKKCYQAILSHFGNRKVKLSYLPLAMRMAGPKEALLHAIIRKNYGAQYFIVGRDHAGPSARNKENKPFYSLYAAQDLLKSHEKELGLKILTSDEMVFIEEDQTYIPENLLTSDKTPLRISGSEIRKRLSLGYELPSWFSYPEIVQILQEYYKNKKGLCLYLVGLSGSGKSTLSSLLKTKIEELDPYQREVQILDGDIIRKYLSSELGFSKKDRSLNVRRIGYVASLIASSGGICICANIAPYEEDRLDNRQLITPKGLYFEIFVDTPLEICEKRDVKGLYKLAREGKIKEFTGISDPFEIPQNSNIVVNGENDPDHCVEQILSALKEIYLPLND